MHNKKLFLHDKTFIFYCFFINIHPRQEEYAAKHWRTITFRPDHAIQLKKNNHFVFICQRANRGECKHAVCHECHEEQSNAQKRSRDGVLSEHELMQTCRHKLCNLQLCADVWWCTRDYLGGPQWSEHAMGCAFCERMFTMGDTKWRTFHWALCLCFEQGCYDLGCGCYGIYMPVYSVA